MIKLLLFIILFEEKRGRPIAKKEADTHHHGQRTHGSMHSGGWNVISVRLT